MKIKYSFTTALAGLRTNKMRSALTILGIVIGVGSIMFMMSVGQGAQKLIIDEISGLGAETVVIRPGQEPEGPTDVGQTLFADSLKRRDLDFLKRKENVPHAVDFMPALVVPGSVSFEGETFNPEIFGGDVEFFAGAFNVQLRDGIFFDENDIRSSNTVVVIGSKVKEELFGNTDALGKFVRIKDTKFRVVGVFAPKGQVSFFNFDEVVVLPYTTAQAYLLGIDYFHEIIVKTESPEFVSRTVRDIEATMREAHGITDPDKDDFFVVTQQGVVEQISSILGALTAFLSSVVAVALVVGGIGIMNIMLVSVTERTKEIGLRKALGATDKNILTQFLLEAVVLTAIGGLVGILIGGILSFGAALALKHIVKLSWDFVFPQTALVLGLSVSTSVGIIFGLYPAKQAAKKSPMEALRYE